MLNTTVSCGILSHSVSEKYLADVASLNNQQLGWGGCVCVCVCVCLGGSTYLVAGGQVLVLLAGVPLLTVQEQEVDHLLLVVTAEGKEG